MKILKAFFQLYRVDEFDSRDPGYLPQAPSVKEKYSYIKRYNKVIIIFSVISFIAIQLSMFNFLEHNNLMWLFFGYYILTIIYFLDSLLVNLFSKDFDITAHNALVRKWHPYLTERVDIFLPTAGESLEVLQNTWDGIIELQRHYKGKIVVYCLDDSARKEVKALARSYAFYYKVRPKRGWYKKAGNLRHGFKISNGEFIAIFDADFRPRPDFLDEILPYFHENKSLGLVQSPQYFDVHPDQNWLQRGAGAVQELFYRVSQVSRQNHNASICVGSNAVYRRTALDDTGGTALIEHSEDVHTGFNMRIQGWSLQYIPVILAKGLCPADMKAFFKQQYRWCLGSMTLLTSSKFWKMRLSFMARLSYFSGFLYYIHTGISTFFVPILPLGLIWFYPEQVTLQNYLFILPSLIFVQLIYPLWHRTTYGIEAWSTRSIYGWAHMFAIIDAITQQKMQWQPTGSKGGKDYRYSSFRVLQIVFNFIPAVLWVYFAAEKVVFYQEYVFWPLLAGGIYYYFITAKVTFYFVQSRVPAQEKKQRSFGRIGARTAFMLITLLFIVVTPLTWQLKQVISEQRKEQMTQTKKQSISVITKNRKIITTAMSPQGQGTQSAQLEKGDYLAVAKNGDSYRTMIQRIMNTYSAETGDLLTLRERTVLEEYIILTLPKKLVVQGEELRVSRRLMKLYLEEIRKIL